MLVLLLGDHLQVSEKWGWNDFEQRDMGSMRDISKHEGYLRGMTRG